MNQRTQNFLRWVAVPFASIIGALLFHVFFKIVTNLASSPFFVGSPPQFIQYIIDCMVEATTGAGFVIAGVYTAPNYKIKTATILTILFALAMIVVIVSTIIKWENVESPIWSIISCLSALAGAIAAYTDTKESSDK